MKKQTQKGNIMNTKTMKQKTLSIQTNSIHIYTSHRSPSHSLLLRMPRIEEEQWRRQAEDMRKEQEKRKRKRI
jgi:hypothetical protein